ncbi:YtxH domain-containing protein [Streptococcus hillyeri]|uniref:YtxH domain-containing protein n=1 Tax=Streptococcus hillyeri TaxID=2282420 RepID=A0A3L9DZZ5_9STRE|nr:YtxH domain-containing protein [Streptococcus hillyeri]RLY04722.1 YtxH domain-containing protein [Streptococcus hillyeri]
MGKFLKSVILGAASGAAAAYFLGTEKGKELVAKAKENFDDYKANPDAYHEAAKGKVAEYKDLATETFTEYKGKWESGEFSAENIGQAVKATVEQVKEKVSETVQTVSEEDIIIVEVPEEVVKEDIVIDLTDQSDTDLSEDN